MSDCGYVEEVEELDKDGNVVAHCNLFNAELKTSLAPGDFEDLARLAICIASEQP